MNNMNGLKVGDIIQAKRKERSLTQVVLAQRAHISRTYLADIENNRYNPSMSTLQDIAIALQTSVAGLLPKEENLSLTGEQQKKIYEILAGAAETKGVTLGFAAVRSGIKPDFTPRLKEQKLHHVREYDLIALARYLDTESKVLDVVQEGSYEAMYKLYCENVSTNTSFDAVLQQIPELSLDELMRVRDFAQTLVRERTQEP